MCIYKRNRTYIHTIVYFDIPDEDKHTNKHTHTHTHTHTLSHSRACHMHDREAEGADLHRTSSGVESQLAKAQQRAQLAEAQAAELKDQLALV
jgi:hypothetical protein